MKSKAILALKTIFIIAALIIAGFLIKDSPHHQEGIQNFNGDWYKGKPQL